MARKTMAILLVVGMMGCGSTGTSGKAATTMLTTSNTTLRKLPDYKVILADTAFPFF